MSQRRVKSSQTRSSQRVVDLTQEILSQTQTQSQTRTKQSQSQKVSNSELREAANKAVFYLLAVHGCKGVIKRSDLTSSVISKEHSRQFRTIIDLANKKLKMVREVSNYFIYGIIIACLLEQSWLVILSLLFLGCYLSQCLDNVIGRRMYLYSVPVQSLQ